jgi:hypothetical protein
LRLQNDAFIPVAASVDIRIPQYFSNDQLTTISQEGYRVGFGLIDTSAQDTLMAFSENVQRNNAPHGQARVLEIPQANQPQARTRQEQIAQHNETIMEADNMVSAVLFEEVLPGVELEYIVSARGVNEHIIINESQEEYAFYFRLEFEGLIPAPQENGDIALFRESDFSAPLFMLQVPFMFDAAGEAYSVDMEMYNGVVVVNADADWINAATMPVTIVPMSVQTVLIRGDRIEDTYILESIGSSGGNNLINFVGTRSILGLRNGRHRTFMRFDFSGLIPTGNRVISASLHLAQNRTYSHNTNMHMEIHRVTQQWPSGSMNWGNQPSAEAQHELHCPSLRRITMRITTISPALCKVGLMVLAMVGMPIMV